MAALNDTADPAQDIWTLSTAKIAAASVALTAIASRMESMCLFIRSAQRPGAGRAAIDHHLQTLQSEIRTAACDAGFNEPWEGSWYLAGRWGSTDGQPSRAQTFEQEESFEPGESAGEDEAPSLAGFQGLLGLYSEGSAAGNGILSFVTEGSSEADLDLMAELLAEALSGVSAAQNFLGALSDSSGERSLRDLVFGAGIRSLVRSDMDEASTRIAALDIQQKLCVQSLSIANDNAAIMLRLLG